MDVAQAVREARQGARLSQEELARRAGTTQSAVSTYEVGRRVPSWRTLDRLLEVCGLTARLRLQPRSMEIDRELDAALAKSPAERLWKWELILERVAELDSPVVVTGAAAHLAHGVPVPVEAVDLAVGTEPADVTGAVRLLEALGARYHPASFDDPVPSFPTAETVTVPGRRRLMTPMGAVVVWPGALASVRERAVGVQLGDGIVWVAALSDIEPPAEDADLVRRYLERLGARSRDIR